MYGLPQYVKKRLDGDTSEETISEYGYVRIGDYFFHERLNECVVTPVRDFLDDLVPTFELTPDEIESVKHEVLHYVNYLPDQGMNFRKYEIGRWLQSECKIGLEALAKANVQSLAEALMATRVVKKR